MPTFSDYIEEFLQYKRAQRLSPTTLVEYESALRRFAAAMDDRDLRTITTKMLISYFASLNVSKKRLRNIHSILSSLWNWAQSVGYCEENIVRQIKPPRPEKRPIVPYTREHIVRFLEAVERMPVEKTDLGEFDVSLRNKAIILLLLDTGIRASELCKLREKDLGRETIYVKGKGSKDRLVPVSQATLAAIRAYREAWPVKRKNYLFTSIHGNPLRPDTLLALIQKVAREAGVPNAYTHRFRHTFAINFLRNGGDAFTLQLILGHETLDMVKRYLAIAQSDIRAAHRKASPVKAWELG